MRIEELFDRHLPLAIVAALLLQGGTAVWWAASKDTEDRFQQQRIDSLETTMAKTDDGQTQILERLARIEERVNLQLAVLDRIERRMGAPRK